MFKRLRILLLVPCLAALYNCAQEPASGTLAKIKDSNSITLGHRESSVPFSYYDDQQRVVGYSHELALRVVDKIKEELKLPDLQVKLNPVTSQNRIPLVQNGTVDLECGSTTNNTERQQQVAFSNSIFLIGTRLLTPGESGIKEFPDLAGKTVVTTAGTTSERLIRKMNEEKNMKMDIISAKDHGEAFLIAQSGRAVAFMMDDALLYGERAKAKNPEEWIVTGESQSSEVYGCMMRRDDPQFKKLVDSALAEIMKSGEINKLYAKWFQSPVPPKGLNLNFPMSDELQALFKSPNDKAVQ